MRASAEATISKFGPSTVIETDHASTARKLRVESVDVVRGIAMILMALDHTRDFFGVAGDPTNLAQASTALFLTRWVTHVCAPTFFLLAGTGAALSLSRKSRAELAGFLFTRGLWLIFLEMVVVRCFGLQFNFDYRVTLLEVIWALGLSMIVLSGLVFVPVWLTGAIGVALIAGHNLLDGVRSANPIWVILHGPGFVLRSPEHTVFAAYPLVPWIGVTAAGYVLGFVYAWPAERRRALLLRLALALPCAFALIRFFNHYGDPSPWRVQTSALRTILSFLNTTKYPPSLLFLLMTLGFTMLGLWAFDKRIPRVLTPALGIGRVPLFYFLVHLPLIHALAAAAAYVRYGSARWFFDSPSLDRYPFTRPPGWGYSLPVVYALWALVVISLYPLCRWFGEVRARSQARWLSYL
jgi:uncharacterized membrane protein